MCRTLHKLWLLNLLAPSFPNVKHLARDTQIALSDDLQDATSFPHKPLLNKTQELVKASTILKVWNLNYPPKDDGLALYNTCTIKPLG